jgi:hypothetical protein
MNLAAPYFSSPCPTPKIHEGRTKRPIHQLACKGNKQFHPLEHQSTSGSSGRGAKLAFELGVQIAERAPRPRRSRENVCHFVAMHFVA